MSISYPVDVNNTKWAVLDTNTGEIIARRKQWPVADGSPIPGLDPRYVYLLHVDDTEPDYDSRIYTLQSTETVDANANTLTLSHAAVKRPTEEQKVSAENEEARQFGQHVIIEREVIQTRLMVGAILAYIVDSQQFPPKVQTMATNYVNKATTLWKNRDRLQAILAEIDAGTEPDLDAGWEPTA